jgi:hypothetical protein
MHPVTRSGKKKGAGGGATALILRTHLRSLACVLMFFLSPLLPCRSGRLVGRLCGARFVPLESALALHQHARLGLCV